MKDNSSYKGDEPSESFIDHQVDSFRNSPLAFLLQETKISKRKRSRKLKSTLHSDFLAEGQSKAAKHLNKPFLAQQGQVFDSEKLSLSLVNASKELSKSSITSHLQLKQRSQLEPENRKPILFSQRADNQPMLIPSKGNPDFVGSATRSYDKKRQYKAQYCQYAKEPCYLYVLHGFKFCMLHILEDCSAPYKQCDFVEERTQARCGFCVSLNLVDARSLFLSFSFLCMPPYKCMHVCNCVHLLCLLMYIHALAHTCSCHLS